MNDPTPLRLGTRGSELALWQARRMARVIEERLHRPCTIEIVKTQGDRIQDVAFHKMEGKGFFTKELQEALLARQVDLVVHSLKDLPTDEPPGLVLAAIPERENPADLLLARRGLLDPTPTNPLGLPPAATVGTSSLRRAAQVLALRASTRLTALRGNVPTRVNKLRGGQYDAIVIAAAGVHRLELDLSDLDALELPPEVMLSAPGQGALGIECRAGGSTEQLLAQLHDQRVARAVGAERMLLKLLGGGCHLPLGCLATEDDAGVRLQAALGEVDEEITKSKVARVATVAPSPETAARGCFEALRQALPEVVAAGAEGR